MREDLVEEGKDKQLGRGRGRQRCRRIGNRMGMETGWRRRRKSSFRLFVMRSGFGWEEERGLAEELLQSSCLSHSLPNCSVSCDTKYPTLTKSL
jgi:hypothetical protein